MPRMQSIGRILKRSDVIELMTSVQGQPKCELQSHVLGILSVYAMISAASTTGNSVTVTAMSLLVSTVKNGRIQADHHVKVRISRLLEIDVG